MRAKSSSGKGSLEKAGAGSKTSPMASQSATEATPISEQKRRALDALERRMAFDKAKSVQEEQHKNKKVKINPKEDRQRSIVKGPRAEAPDPNPSPSSTKKGKVVFSGYTPAGENPNPAYDEFSQVVHENLVGATFEGSSKGDAVNKIVLNLLQHGDKGLKYTRGSKAMKVDSWLLLDNFVPKTGSLVDARLKALQSHSKRSKKHMTMRQHRKCGSFDLSKEYNNFNLFMPLHETWKEYIIALLKYSRCGSSEKQLAQCLLVADLNGAYLQVVECKQNVAFTGVSGIMIRETTETLQLITQEDKVRVVPKRGSVFILQAAFLKITLFGDKLLLRNIAT